MSRAALACCVLALAGCAAFVDKLDYADYRKVRLAPNEAERLVAVSAYVAAHPDGHWFDELSAEQQRREAEIYEQGKASRAGLDLYIRAYPHGHFVDQARARLAAIAQIDQRKAQERAAAEQAAADKRVRDEELRRTWVTRFFGYWADTLLAVRQWGAPIADVARQNPEFSRAFGKSPRPQCNANECVKHYRSSFGVPVPGGTRVERTIDLTLRLALRDGRVTRVELLFPRRGFSRWFELENRRVSVDEDPQMRTEAITWAMAKIKPLLIKIGEPHVEINDLAFEAVLAPSLGPSGEVTDTTATDPSSQAQGVEAQASATTSGEPTSPDMVMGPILIPEQGSTVQTMQPNAAPQVPAAGDSGEVMTLGPIEAGPAPDATQGEGATMTLGAIDVGAVDPNQPGATTTASTPTAGMAPPAQGVPQQVYALSAGGLRAIVFAETPGGWDGLRIEAVAQNARAQSERAPNAPRAATPRR